MRRVFGWAVVACLITSPLAAAGSGPLWFRCTTSPIDLACNTETYLLPAFKVDASGPVTVTVTAQTGGTITLTVVDSCGLPVHTQSLSFVTGQTSSQYFVFNAAAAGIYRLKTAGDIFGYGRFQFSATSAKFVMPEGINWGPYPDAVAVGSGDSYFYVPAGTSAFTFRVHAGWPLGGPEWGAADVYDSTGTLRLSVPAGQGDRSFSITVPAGSAGGFWRAHLQHSGDLRFYVTGIPAFFAETPEAWFMPDVNVPAGAARAGDVVTGDTELFCSALSIEFLTPDEGAVLATAALTSNSCSHFSFAVPDLAPGPYRVRVRACGSIRTFDFTVVGEPSPDLTVLKTHSSTFKQGDHGRTYSIAVRNAGPVPSSGTVTVTDVLPAKLTATAIAGEGWDCDLAALSCGRSDALGAGSSYPPITLTVNVAEDAPALVTNAVTVSGGGDPYPWNNTAQDPTTIVLRIPTTLTVASTPEAAATGTTVTVTAHVSPSSVTGNVDFEINGTPAGSVSLSNGVASMTTSFAVPGSHIVSASYAGDSDYRASSGSLTIWAYGEHRQAGTGDFDGDGKSDVLWRNVATGEVGLWLMNGTAIGAGGAVGAAPIANTIAGVGDFDHDGRSDILWRDPGGGVGMWLMNGLTIAGGGYAGGGPVTTKIAGVGDFNGDGFDDILFQSGDPAGPFGAAFGIWIMHGSTIVGSKLVVQLQGFEIQGIGDFDGDGASDLLFRDGTGAHYACLMNGFVIKGWLAFGTLVPSWDAGGTRIVAGTGDFDGDGKDEILLRDRSGAVSVFKASAVPVASVPFALTVSGTGDYDGDGKADVLWSDTTCGVGVWLMNGKTIVSAGLLASAPPLHEIQ